MVPVSAFTTTIMQMVDHLMRPLCGAIWNMLPWRGCFTTYTHHHSLSTHCYFYLWSIIHLFCVSLIGGLTVILISCDIKQNCPFPFNVSCHPLLYIVEYMTHCWIWLNVIRMNQTIDVYVKTLNTSISWLVDEAFYNISLLLQIIVQLLHSRSLSSTVSMSPWSYNCGLDFLHVIIPRICWYCNCILLFHHLKWLSAIENWFLQSFLPLPALFLSPPFAPCCHLYTRLSFFNASCQHYIRCVLKDRDWMACHATTTPPLTRQRKQQLLQHSAWARSLQLFISPFFQWRQFLQQKVP